MNHSTTGTSTYLLCKYSRSYPTKRTQSSQLGLEVASDWQHFTNPIIRLVLDVKKARNGEIDSVRLRILWQMNSDSGLSGDVPNQPDVVFEDMDLLSFSPMNSAAFYKTSAEGLPLKVVYRDTVVGIRYLHCRENNIPVYRRMQISFYSASEASDFIEIIRPICPCRLNPSTAAVPTQARTQAQTTERPMLRTQMTDFPSRTSSILTSGPLPPIPNPRPDAQMPNSYGQQISSPSILGPLRSSSPVIPHLNPPDILLRLSSDDSNVIRQTNVCSNSVPSITQLQPTPYPTQLPSSSLPSSSSANLDQPSSHSVPAPLASSRSVYDMSNAALEQLIGEIIHEDGFVQLLERMSQMLTVRNLVDG